MPVSRAFPNLAAAVDVNPGMTWQQIIAVQALAAATAGRPLVFAPGEYLADTKELLPNLPLDIVLGAGVRIVQTLVPDLDPVTAAFAAKEGAVGLQTTLTADAEAGATQLQTDDDIPAGSIVRLNAVGVDRQFHAATRRVLASAPSGPDFLLTIDAPLLERFETGEGVSQLASVPTEIRIFGGGAHISGTGDRYVEIAGGQRCLIEEMIADGRDGFAVGNLFAFDVGGRENLIRRVFGDGGDTARAGVVLESNELSSYEHCHVTRATQGGLIMVDCVACTGTDSHGELCGQIGALLTHDGPPSPTSVGCISCSLTRVRGYSNDSYGIQIAAGSVDCAALDCEGRFNTLAGIETGNDTSVNPGVEITGRYTENGQWGVHVGPGCPGFKASVRAANGNAASAGFFESSGDVAGLVSTGGGSTAAVHIQGAGVRVTLRGLDVALAANAYCVLGEANAYFELTDSILRGDGTTAGHTLGVQAIGVGVVRDCKIDNCFAALVATGTIRQDNVDMSTCGIGLFLNGGVISQGDQSTVQLNGATPVAVAWPDIKASDAVNLTLVAIGGVLGRVPTVTVTPGVGFSVVGAIGDTSTYAYEID